jgi:hypothetical protein
MPAARVKPCLRGPAATHRTLLSVPFGNVACKIAISGRVLDALGCGVSKLLRARDSSRRFQA